MNDWDAFVESVPWFLDADADVCVSEPRDGVQLPSSVAGLFRTLANLLAQSLVTPVLVNDDSYELLAWDTADGYRIALLIANA